MSTCLWMLARHSKGYIPKEPSVCTVYQHYCNLLSIYVNCALYLCTRDLSHIKSASAENLRNVHEISQVKCMERTGYRPAQQMVRSNQIFNIC